MNVNCYSKRALDISVNKTFEIEDFLFKVWSFFKRSHIYKFKQFENMCLNNLYLVLKTLILSAHFDNNECARINLGLVYYFMFKKYKLAKELMNIKYKSIHRFSYHFCLYLIHFNLKNKNRQTLINAFQCCKSAAEEGDLNAGNFLSVIYFNTYKYKKAFFWAYICAQKNHAAACNNLGHLYEDGIGTKINLSKALKYYIQASKLGNESGKKNMVRLLTDKHLHPNKYHNFTIKHEC